jgi:hypothetical protein
LAALREPSHLSAQNDSDLMRQDTPDPGIALTTGAAFTSAGYDFKVNSGLVFFLNSAPNSVFATNGTTSLDLGGTVDITSAAHKPFSVTAIDLASGYGPATSTVRFTGTDVNGVQTSQSITIVGAASADPTALQTLALAGFDNLASFEMELVYNADGSAFFSLVDNIVVDDASAAVPEPSACATLGLGLATLAGALRSRKRSAV